MKLPILALLLTLPFALAAEKKPAAAPEPYESITQKQIDAIDYEDAAIDAGFRTPLAKDLSHLDDESKKQLQDMMDKLEDWKGALEPKLGQRVRNWMCLATLMDVGRGQFEAELPHLIFERLKKEVPEEKLKKALAWVILKPAEGTAITKAAEIGIEDDVDEQEVRARAAIYAKKLLGRLVGKLPPKE